MSFVSRAGSEYNHDPLTTLGMHERWRSEKLAFVEGLEGASFLETVCVCMVIPLAVRTQVLLGGSNILLALLLPLILLSRESFVFVAVILLSSTMRFGEEKSTSAVRIVRSGLALGTTLCILAVDFGAFPRSRAKTGSSGGFSLMDAGTGCIVVNNAMVSRGGRKWLHLCGLGLARIAMVAVSEYPSADESEYGSGYWNFFFILAILDKCPPSWPTFIISLTISILARQCPFAFWVSLPGYVALHCAATLVPSTWEVATCTLLGAAYLGASRQRCDVGYVLFAFGLHAASLELSRGLDSRWRRLPRHSLLSTIDRNHSGFFILSNLFTGLYNNCVDTLTVTSFSTTYISLLVYLFATYAVLFFFRYSSSSSLRQQ